MAKNFVTKNFMSPDEAFEKIYGAGAPGAQDGKYMSPDEAFAKIYGNGDSQEMEEAETITPLTDAEPGALSVSRSPDERTGLFEKIYRPLAGGFVGSLGAMTSGAGFGVKWLADNNQIISDEEAARLAALMHGEKATPDDLTFHRRSPVADVLLQEGQRTRELGSEIGWVSNPNLVSETAGALGSMAAYYIPTLLAAPAAGAAAASGRFLATPLGAKAADMAARGAAWLVHSGTEALSNAGGTYNDLAAEGAEDSKAMTAAKRDFFTNYLIKLATEPVGALGGRLGSIPGVKGRVARGLAEALSEGFVEEPSQNLSSNAAKKSLNETYGGFLENLLGEYRDNYVNEVMNVGAPSAIAGGIMGAILPGDVQAFGRVNVKKKAHSDTNTFMGGIVDDIENASSAATRNGVEGANMGADGTDASSRKFVPNTSLLSEVVNSYRDVMGIPENKRSEADREDLAAYMDIFNLYASGQPKEAEALALELRDTEAGGEPKAAAARPQEEALPPKYVTLEQQRGNAAPAAVPDVRLGGVQDGAANIVYDEILRILNGTDTAPKYVEAAAPAPLRNRERRTPEPDVPVKTVQPADADMETFARVRERFVKDIRRFNAADPESLNKDDRHKFAMLSQAANAYSKGDFQRTANILAYLYGKSEEVGGSSEPIAAKERATSELAVPTRKVDADHAYVGKPQPVSGGYQIEKTDGTKVYVPEAIFGDYYQVTPRAHQPVPESKRVVNGYAVGDVFQSADGGAYWVTKVGAKGITLTDGAGKSRNVSMGTMAKSKLVRLSPEHRGDTHYSLAPGYSRTPLYGVEGEEVGARFAGTRADAAESVKPYEENISGRKQIREEMPVEKAPERVVEGAVANESAGNDSKSDVEDYAAEKVVNGTPSREYKYYLHARPAGPGAVPNGLTRIDAEDGGDRHGAVYYDRELSAKEVSDYELVPAEGGIQKEGVPAKNGLVVNGKPEAEEVKPAELSAFTVAKKSPVRRVSEKQRTAAGKRVQENARKASDMQGYHTDGAGRQVFTDTRAVFRLSKPVEGLEATDANATWPAKVEPLFEHVKKEESVALGREEIAEMVERGKRVRGKRAADVPEIITKVGQAYVDSTRLGEVLSVLGTDEVTAYTRKPVAGESGRRYYSNVYFSSANGEALLAPVHLGDAEARAVDSYYKDAATAVRSEAKAAEGSGEETGADKTAGARKAEKGKGERQLDKEYLAAVEVGDMETAQKMVDEAAARKGYAPEADYRSTHQAPSRADADVTLSLEQMRNGESMVPGDFFTHPEYYMDVNDPVTRESLGKFRKALAEGGKLTVYRSVLDKGNKEGAPRNGDWVSLSRRYAQRHGESVGNGKYSVQEIEAGVADLFWDGNDVNELGYDDGESYAYRNTKNNRKLLDAVTRDDKGQVIPLSKRFNKAKADTHYRLGKKPQYVAKAEVEAFVSGLTPGKANIKAVDPKLILKTNKMSPNEMLALSVKEVERLGKTDIVTPLGEKVYFAPGNTEDLKAYTLHLIAGMDKSLSEIRRGRVYGLFTAKETLKDPLVILRQDNGRTFYVSLYDTKSGNMMNGIIVGVEEGQNGRVVTSIIQLDKSRTGNKAIRELKKHIRNAKDVLYLWKGQSGHPRPPTDQHGSMPDVGLPMSGEDNVAQNSISDKIRKNSQQDLQAGLVGAGGQPVESLFDSVKSAGALVNERAGLPPLSVADVAARVKGAKVSGIDDGKMKLEFSNGTAWIVDTQAEAIAADPEVVARDYGRELRPGESVVGRTLVIDGQRFIDMVAGMSDGQTFSHEVFEAAWDSLTKDEQAAVLKTHGSRENAAERYGEFLEGRIGKLTKRTKAIFQRVRDFFSAIRASLFGKNSEDVFREVASGKVLNREAGAVADQEHYRLAVRKPAQERKGGEDDGLGKRDRGAEAEKTERRSLPEKDAQWLRDMGTAELERVVRPSRQDESVKDKAVHAVTDFHRNYRNWVDVLDPLNKFGENIFHEAEKQVYGATNKAEQIVRTDLLPIYDKLNPGEHDGAMAYATYVHLNDIAANSEKAALMADELEAKAKKKQREISEDRKLSSPDKEELSEWKRRVAAMQAERDLYVSQAKALRDAVKITVGKEEEYARAIKKIEAHYPHWAKFQKELAEFNNKELAKLRDAGIVSKEMYGRMRELYPNYVPLQRDFGVDEKSVGGFVGGMGLVNLQNPVKKLKGSKRDIIDPSEQILKNVYAYESLVGRQKVGRMIMEKYDAGDFHDLIEEAENRHHEPNEMAWHVWDNGKKRFFKSDIDIYNALMPKRAGKYDDMLFVRASKWLTKLLRAGVTHDLTYVLRNPVRDQWAYSVVASDVGYVPFVDFARGLAQCFHKDAGSLYDEFMKAGGASGLAGMTKNTQKEWLREIRKEKGSVLVESLKNPPKALYRLLGELSETTELASRMGVYMKAKKAGMNSEDAALKARDVMNFNRSGAYGEGVNQHVAFFNGAVQGEDVVLRSLFKGGKPNKRAFMKAFIYITGMTMLQTLFNYRDDDKRREYLDLPMWRKATCWTFVLDKGDDDYFRLSIPKPQGLLGMLFGTLPALFMDYAHEKDSRVFNGMMSAFVESTTPEFYPLSFLVAAELGANHSFFYDREIVPKREQRFEPRLQYGPYTSELAKAVGGKLNISPRLIEHAALSIGGGLTKSVSNSLDSAIRAYNGENRPSRPWYESYPGVRGFFAPEGHASSDNFQAELELLQKKRNSVEDTLKTKGAKALTETERRFLRASEDIKRLGKLNSGKGGIYDAYSAIRRITTATNIDADEKRRRISRIEQNIDNASKRGLQRIDRINAYLDR